MDAHEAVRWRLIGVVKLYRGAPERTAQSLEKKRCYAAQMTFLLKYVDPHSTRIHVKARNPTATSAVIACSPLTADFLRALFFA
jgi:hypothetical protein